MRGRSLRGRLTFLHGSAIGLSMLIFAASAVWVTGHVLVLEETRELEQTSRRIGADIEEDLSRGGELPEVVRDALEEEPGTEIRVDVHDSRGILLGTTGSARPRPTALGEFPGKPALPRPPRPAGPRKDPGTTNVSSRPGVSRWTLRFPSPAAGGAWPR